MKKIIIVLVIIILILVVGVAVFFALRDNQPELPVEPVQSGDEVEPSTESEKIDIEGVITKTGSQRREISIEMPTFINLNNYTFQENINKKIADSVNPYINEINIMADEELDTALKYKYTVSFDRYNNDDYISIVVLQNYATGGMRSNVWRDTYTIDVVNNRELSLEDVCSSKDYKKIIVDEVNKQAKEKNIKLIAGNGLADIPDTQRFYIKDKKLYIYFEPASIAPYLDGEMHFEMPFEFENGKFIMN